ncbi:hypothetical protein AS149_25920 [Burkholderia cenocepacia]|nr:hypothetical protein AS149_25920 [Burkholderia cenocepacia]
MGWSHGMKVLNVDMSPQERDEIILALQMRIAYIETGDPALRANDAIGMGKPQMVRALSDAQRALIARTEALVKRLLGTR